MLPHLMNHPNLPKKKLSTQPKACEDHKDTDKVHIDDKIGLRIQREIELRIDNSIILLYPNYINKRHYLSENFKIEGTTQLINGPMNRGNELLLSAVLGVARDPMFLAVPNINPCGIGSSDSRWARTLCRATGGDSKWPSKPSRLVSGTRSRLSLEVRCTRAH